MKKYSYTHHFYCEQCKQFTERKTKQKQPQRFCSHKCAIESTKVSPEIKWERAIQAYEKDVIKQEGCWDWKGYKNPKGYAYISGSGKNNARQAHRISYIIHKGIIPDGMHILHSCHNPKCTNPEHLRIGTNQENMIDKINARRQQSTLTFEQVENIKALLKKGEMLHKEIAQMFSVSRECITGINTEKSWGHIEI